MHPDRNLVLAVREDHRGGGEPVNTIVALDLDGDNADGGRVLCSGADFYSTPELSRSGRLAWTEWNHPNMPWDSTTIMVGDLVDRRVVRARPVAGGPGESAMQPRWWGDTLLLLSDRTNWWNLYAWSGETLRPLHPAEAEFGFAQWNLGMTPYAVAGEDRLVCTVNENGSQHVALLTVSTGELVPLTQPGHAASSLAAGSGTVAAVLGHPERPTTVCVLDLDRSEWTDVREAGPMIMDPDSVSVGRTVSWPGEQGPVFGWYYPPANSGYAGPEDARPPLIISSHGGPTGAALPDFRIAYQFWTTRGFAILDVNYSGSVGFGRAYRERLLGAWGVADVRDCAAGALAMVDQGLADAERLVIRGGSAGGYTTLRALTTTTIFAAGISQYGIGDLEALARDTHKFEAALPGPADRALPRGPGGLPGPLAGAPSRPSRCPDPVAAGQRRQSGAPGSGRGDGRGRPGQGPAGGLDHVPRRGPRLPPGRLDPGRDRGPDLLPGPDPRPPAGGRGAADPHRQPRP